MPSASPEERASRRLRNLVLRVIGPYTDQTNVDPALRETVHALERRVRELEFSQRKQAERAERLEVLSQDLVTAIEALRQQAEPRAAPRGGSDA